MMDDSLPQSFEEDDDVDDTVEEPDDGISHDAWLCGVIAKHYREKGILPEVDDFDFEWHQLLDADLEAAKAASLASNAVEIAGTSSAGEVCGTGDGAAGSDAGTGTGSDFGSFGSDFGGDFGSGFGGGS